MMMLAIHKMSLEFSTNICMLFPANDGNRHASMGVHINDGNRQPFMGVHINGLGEAKYFCHIEYIFERIKNQKVYFL